MDAMDAYRTMWRIRLFEEAVEDLYGRGMMHGTMHLSIGQEAVPTGACAALKDGDQITSTHRGHGHCIAKGVDVKAMMAEIAGYEIEVRVNPDFVRSGEVKRLQGDGGKLERVVGTLPAIPLKETLAWMLGAGN